MEQEIQTTFFDYVTNRSDDRPVKIVYESNLDYHFTQNDDNTIDWIIDMKLDNIGNPYYIALGYDKSDFSPDKSRWEKLLIGE